jgi:hypothetical protein
VTTALLWWAGVMALTGGLVVGVRAWPWSADQADPSELRTRHLGARLALLPVVVLLALTCFLSIVFLGWSSAPTGWARLGQSLPLLATGAVTGVCVVVCIRTIAGRRARSWWSLTGLLPAVAGAVTVLGA